MTKENRGHNKREILNSRIAMMLLLLLSTFILSACGNKQDRESVIATGVAGTLEVNQLQEAIEAKEACLVQDPRAISKQIYPAEGEIVLNLQPEFVWSFSFGCRPFGFEIAVRLMTDPYPHYYFSQSIEGLETSYDQVQLFPASWHEWVISTTIKNGSHTASHRDYDPVTFVSGPTCNLRELVAPQLIYPANRSVYTGKTTGSYYEVETDIAYPEGTCIPEGFEISISESPDFSTLNLNGVSAALRFKPNPEGLLLFEDDSDPVPNCTRLYWKAWGTVGGEKGPESEVFTFFTNFKGSDCSDSEDTQETVEVAEEANPPTLTPTKKPAATHTSEAPAEEADPATATFTPSPTLTPSPVPDPINASISGFTWNDNNGNGNRDSGEESLAQTSVKLGAGACPSTGLASIITNVIGLYNFTDLASGTYCVSATRSGNITSPTSPTNANITVELSASQSFSVDFGFQKTID